ncbi:hypothetical protein TUBRATIS_006150 [Tubulinosema ratisbonensis]|uniref:Uncharacterized protein n=1 Tax=Tubulinosema ratisbonensis TaxID=291195 RepID=A0A437APG2_9MICR|nr:hypothetical protein TUBRATIS_006150 [Tubulinosema ratisbonensis]
MLKIIYLRIKKNNHFMQILKKSTTENTTNFLIQDESLFCITLETLGDSLPVEECYFNNDLTSVEIYKNNDLVEDYYLIYIIERLLVEKLKKQLKIKFYFFDTLDDKQILFGIKEILLNSNLIKESDLIIEWDKLKRIFFMDQLIYQKRFY